MKWDAGVCRQERGNNESNWSGLMLPKYFKLYFHAVNRIFTK